MPTRASSCTSVPPGVASWHEVVDASPDRRRDLLLALLAEDAVFRSPAVHAPMEGRPVTALYLGAAMAVLGPTLRYDRELYGEDSAVLEFTATVGEREVHGIDFLRFDADDRIVEFTVMIRPLRGLEAIVAAMRTELTARADD